MQYVIILYLEYVGAPKPIFAPHTYYTCDFDYKIGICWCTKPPVLHQHICYICIFIIELSMLVLPNPFCITYMLNSIVT